MSSDSLASCIVIDFVNMKHSFLAVAAQSQIQIKFKMISTENAHNKGNLSAVCLLSYGAGLWPWEDLTYVWEDCALSCRKPINWDYLITFHMFYCAKPPIIFAVPFLLSSSSSE